MSKNFLFQFYSHLWQDKISHWDAAKYPTDFHPGKKEMIESTIQTTIDCSIYYVYLRLCCSLITPSKRNFRLLES